jgi:hypothetical protein
VLDYTDHLAFNKYQIIDVDDLMLCTGETVGILPNGKLSSLWKLSGLRQDRCKREKKVVVLMELHRAILYTTEMSKQMTKSHVRDAVHMYTVN